MVSVDVDSLNNSNVCVMKLKNIKQTKNKNISLLYSLFCLFSWKIILVEKYSLLLKNKTVKWKNKKSIERQFNMKILSKAKRENREKNEENEENMESTWSLNAGNDPEEMWAGEKDDSERSISWENNDGNIETWNNGISQIECDEEMQVRCNWQFEIEKNKKLKNNTDGEQ